MATFIKYSQAEKESFKIVPETCPAVEKALDTAFQTPSLSDNFVADIFAKYNIVPDKNMTYAIQEVMGRLLFNRKVALKDVVLYEGTFPLRAALVDEVREARGLPIERNRFTEWVRDFHERKQYRTTV